MTLKTKNSPYIIAFCILLYVGLAIMNGLDWSFAESIEITESGVKLDSSILSTLFYFISLALVYFLPPELKHRLVFLRWKNPLPGSRAFSELVDKDTRISKEDLEREYGTFPVEPDEQNGLWYKIYKTKQSDKVVQNSHGRWLLFRDIFCTAFVVFLPASIFTCWHSGVLAGVLFSLVYLAALVALWICARNTGVRFTCNVLAR